MAAVKHMSEDHLLCCICLEVFTDPVSTPCGHNFCKSCISQHWDQTELCQCPLCKEEFSSRPLLRVNTLVSEMVSVFRSIPPQHSVSSELQPSAGDILCDMCTEPKLKALRSCLVCLLSYCPLHLEPHESVARLKKHQLTEPVENLEERMCPKHDKPLELFCRSDDVCVCMLCTVLEHKNHHIIPMKEEYDEQRAALKHTQAHAQHMTEQRRLKIQEIRQSLYTSQKQANRQMKEWLRVYKYLMNTLQKSVEQFKQELQEKQEKSEEEAEAWITELEKEISELENKSTEMEQLKGSEDHLHFVQRVTSLKTTADMKDWTQIRLESSEGSVKKALDKLWVNMNTEFRKLKMYIEKKLKSDTVHV